MFVGPRTFIAANGVFPDINYFIQPDDAVKCLTTFIIQGKFCLLHGHRQSGKTTIIQAIARHLQEISDRVGVNGFPTGLEVYIISLNVGIDVENGVDSFWGSLCRKMFPLVKSQSHHPPFNHFFAGDLNHNLSFSSLMKYLS